MKLVRSILIALSLMFAAQTHAYDIDTHFYGTYTLARFAGIRHEIALKIANGAQWMDEAYISEPLSMIILPMTGVKKRRLLHFPGSSQANKMTIDTLPSILEPSTGIPIKAFTETEADHEFATEMFTEGLMEGNLMKASAGLHTLEDSFAHAGTIAELGHAHFWHHPDRPFASETSVAKYFKMTRSVLRAMVAIRSLLPMSGLDLNVRFGDTFNYQMGADRLADIYEQLPQVQKTVSKKILNDPQYVRFALQNVFERANKVKYVGDGYQSYLNNFTPGDDTYKAAASVARSFPAQMIDVSAIMSDNGLGTKVTREYILSVGGEANLFTRVVNNLLNGIVPKPLDEYHRFEKEEDGPIWVKELDLRVANMRALVWDLFKKDIFFVKNNSSDKKGFMNEISSNAAANPTYPRPSAVTEYSTYSLKEKNEFNTIIFSFIFPKLYDYVKDDMPSLVSYIETADDLMSKDKSFMAKVESGYDFITSGFRKTSLTQALKIGFDDIRTSHLIPHEYNKYYVVPSLLKRQIDRGQFKPLLTTQQVEALITK